MFVFLKIWVANGETDHGDFIIWELGVVEFVLAIHLLEDNFVADYFCC